jgi:hypothetical protein
MVNTNPFSSSTTGGRAGSFVYVELDREQNYETASAALSRSAKYEAEDQERVNNYVIVMEALDQSAIDKLNIINGKKEQIVTIINNAYDASAKGSGTFETEEQAQADTDAAKILFAAGITTFTYACNFDDPPECEIGAKAPMYPDILVAWHYPKVESLDASAVFYQQGESLTPVGNNLGIGVTAYVFGDAAGVTGFTGLVTTSNASLGDYYFFSNIDSIIAGSATSISNLITEIETLRTEVNEFVVGVSSGTNQVRILKSNAQVDLWFEKKGQEALPVGDYTDGLNNLNTNSEIIQSYNG